MKVYFPAINIIFGFPVEPVEPVWPVWPVKIMKTSDFIFLRANGQRAQPM
jgi:hypothetical protein